jgi:RNA polymerase sigma-70 factor (ECF subfamily)
MPILRAIDPAQKRVTVDPSGDGDPDGALAGRNSGRQAGSGTGGAAAGRRPSSEPGRRRVGGKERQKRTEEGDPEELHQLVVEHGDAIYRLALSVVRDPSLAEDIAQETLVKAWLALPSFRGDSSLRGWVLRIAHNTAISTIRKRRAVVIDPHDLPERETGPDRSVESSVQSEAVMSEFVEALETLDDLSRTIVVLRELEGLSYEEIAEVVNVPMPTVKTRLFRARRRLGSALREWS